ncbi:Transcriptional regulator, LysR family [plant metagenome]|uniref:Transcriptional regulator, LysR family n=1 Tax=plant metagenome TaxID=1297885 RepID=A0A484P6Y9_9ZZZZ
MTAALDIDLLRTFHAVARLGQFRAAAEQVHRSPAAVSVQIQRLESVAGGRLFERDNQSVSLTPLGQRLLSGTAPLLGMHDRLLDDLHGTSPAGRLKLGVPDEYAGHVIRDILPRFAASWPNVVLEVTTAPSQSLREQTERGRLHVALLVQPRGRKPDARAVTQTTPVWVAGLGADVALEASVPLALHAAHCPYRDAMIASLARAGVSWRVVLSSPSSQAVQACVEAGLGVSLVDRSRVTAAMRVLEGWPAVAPHEVVLWRAASMPSDPAATLMEEALRQHFRL